PAIAERLRNVFLDFDLIHELRRACVMCVQFEVLHLFREQLRIRQIGETAEDAEIVETHCKAIGNAAKQFQVRELGRPPQRIARHDHTRRFASATMQIMRMNQLTSVRKGNLVTAREERSQGRLMLATRVWNLSHRQPLSFLLALRSAGSRSSRSCWRRWRSSNSTQAAPSAS